MGKKNTAAIEYLGKRTVFADVFNYYLYAGETVISPEDLTELDTRETGIPYRSRTGTEQAVEKSRDLIKSVKAMKGYDKIYMILAIEEQSNVHYAMPVKNMVYDALHYAKQVRTVTDSHKQSKDYQGKSSDEYLSGFMKGDYLVPIITLVVYLGNREWDGAMSIHEMFPGTDEKVLALIPDYRINLIQAATMKDEEFERFSTDLGAVLSFIKYSENKEKLRRHVWEDRRFQEMSREAVSVLNACAGAEIKPGKNEEAINVCKAIEDIREEGREAGREEVRKEMCKAIEDIREEGREAGREEVRQEMCKALEDIREKGREAGREEVRQEMCKAIEDIREEGREAGREEVRQEMCKALEDIREEGREAGREEVRQEMCKAIEDIREEGRETGELLKLISLVRKKKAKGFTAQETAEIFEENLKQIQDIYDIIAVNPVALDDEIVKQIGR